MINVRSATEKDISRLVNLGRKTFEESFSKDNTPANMATYLNASFNFDQISKELAERGSQYFIAEEGDEFVGYARVRQSDEVKDYLVERSLELQRIYVDGGHQGKKIGVALMKACLDYARQHQFHWLWLGVWEQNFKAQHFYQQWGFEKFGEHIFQMGDDPQTDWLMKKRIIN
ncbi:MAG TPA: GNAT family N-acetyltransferase [Cyclobacteriaceae bacterium]|nr:GNAT family N-acetyltransferase [Cyclobacteriaceae bacterium]